MTSAVLDTVGKRRKGSLFAVMNVFLVQKGRFLTRQVGDMVVTEVNVPLKLKVGVFSTFLYY